MGQGTLWGPAGRSWTGQGTHWAVDTGQGTLGEVRDGSGDPRGCLG